MFIVAYFNKHHDKTPLDSSQRVLQQTYTVIKSIHSTIFNRGTKIIGNLAVQNNILEDISV